MKAIRLKMAAGALALVVGRRPYRSGVRPTDRSGTGRCGDGTDAGTESLHDKRRKTQEKIIAAEAAVTVALDRVHSVENKMLEYLSNAQGASTEPLPDQTCRGTG